jgi:hypothetical protein
MKISVAMCTFNGAPYLRQQLDSIAAQTQLPYELIVCDDGSTDESVNIIESFAASAHFPVQLHINSENQGSTRTFERAIELCTGDVIALCDQDDYWVPAKLARLAVEFARKSRVGMVFTDAQLVDEDMQPLGSSLWQKLNFSAKERERLRQGSGFDSLLQGATVTGATLAFRSRYRQLVLPIPDGLPLIHDGWIALLVAAVSDVVPLSESLVKYRQHSSQQVGAQERLGPRQAAGLIAPARQAFRRDNPYAEILAIALAVQTRLMERREQFDSKRVVPGLQAKIAHLTARSKLPRPRLARAQRLLRELLTGRYHRYSNGFRSAFKDLLA